MNEAMIRFRDVDRVRLVKACLSPKNKDMTLAPRVPRSIDGDALRHRFGTLAEPRRYIFCEYNPPIKAKSEASIRQGALKSYRCPIFILFGFCSGVKSRALAQDGRSVCDQ